MQKIKAIRVELELYQLEGIAPLLREVHEASEAGKPGFLAAQIMGDAMHVFFIDYDRALKFQELMGQEIGRVGRGYYANGDPIPTEKGPT